MSMLETRWYNNWGIIRLTLWHNGEPEHRNNRMPLTREGSTNDGGDGGTG